MADLKRWTEFKLMKIPPHIARHVGGEIEVAKVLAKAASLRIDYRAVLAARWGLVSSKKAKSLSPDECASLMEYATRALDRGLHGKAFHDAVLPAAFDEVLRRENPRAYAEKLAVRNWPKTLGGGDVYERMNRAPGCFEMGKRR